MGDIGAAWGAFGAVWTGIAVAHTLYAPREVILWNWRRTLLLGLSIALAVGNQFSFAVIVLAGLLLMLWVAPVRKRAVLVIWASAVAVALVILFASYFFHPTVMWQGLLHARWLDLEPGAFTSSYSYAHITRFIFEGSPAMMLVLPLALIAYGGWKRARYFGNTSPLAVAALLMVLAIASPSVSGQGFQLALLVFLFVFAAGVFADLLETRKHAVIMSGMCGLLIASAIWNVIALARLGSR